MTLGGKGERADRMDLSSGEKGGQAVEGWEVAYRLERRHDILGSPRPLVLILLLYSAAVARTLNRVRAIYGAS